MSSAGQTGPTTGDFARMDGAGYRSQPYDGGPDWAADVAARRYAGNPLGLPTTSQASLAMGAGPGDINGLDLPGDRAYGQPTTPADEARGAMLLTRMRDREIDAARAREAAQVLRAQADAYINASAAQAATLANRDDPRTFRSASAFYRAAQATGVSYGGTPDEIVSRASVDTWVDPMSGLSPEFGGFSGEGTWQGGGRGNALLGATAGVGSSLGKMAVGAGLFVGRGLVQLGDVLTLGANHDHPAIQQVWAEQQAAGTALANAVASPRLTTTDIIESVANRYNAAMAQGDDYDRSYGLGSLFNDVGQGALGLGATVRSATRLGAVGLEYIGENAFMGPMAGSRSAQIGAINLSSPRYQPGVVTYGDDLVVASGDWLTAGTPTPIPLQIAKQLNGKSFNTFGEMKSALWEAIGNDAELSAGFRQKSFQELQAGRAPFAPPAYQNRQFGLKFNLHHPNPVGNGGAVYDLSNIRIVSPKTHTEIHYP